MVTIVVVTCIGVGALFVLVSSLETRALRLERRCERIEGELRRAAKRADVLHDDLARLNLIRPRVIPVKLSDPINPIPGENDE